MITHMAGGLSPPLMIGVVRWPLVGMPESRFSGHATVQPDDVIHWTIPPGKIPLNTVHPMIPLKNSHATVCKRVKCHALFGKIVVKPLEKIASSSFELKAF